MENAPLEKVQDCIYSIFVAFDRICRKHNLNYSMEGGTLMGAVKYRNYVPWDDDIDVVMVREEYERFLKIAPLELSDKFFLQSYNNVPSFPLNYAKLCYKDSGIYDYEYSHIKTMNHGVFMDIFPLDEVNPEKLKRHCSFVGVLTGARKVKLGIKLGKLGTKRMIIYRALSILPMKLLCHLVTKACTFYNGKGTGYTYEVCNSNRKFKPLESRMYENLTELQFRDKKFMAISEYDKFLKSRFGDDYMESLPKEEDRRPSHNRNIIIDK